MPDITFIIFVRGLASTPIEQLVADAQIAATLDLIETARAFPRAGPIVLVTAAPRLAAPAAALGAQFELDPPGQEFHWGRRLTEIVEKYRAETPFYVGGGSTALLSPTKLARVAHSIATARERVITNNYFSSDWAAWTPGTAITRIEPPALDNDLAWRLNRQAGLDVAVWPKSAATLFDIDTPTDLMILSRSPQLSPRLGAYLQRLPLETARVDALAQLLNDPRAELVVAGRVSAFTIQQLEQNSPAQFRVFSEERGMRASGRLARGAVRSLLGMLYESVGPQRFFERLAELGQGAILDTRVLLAHGGRQVATPDRFYCDTLEAEKIVDAFAREFTLAARESGLPLLLGGHSLVSGGLAALLELYKRAA